MIKSFRPELENYEVGEQNLASVASRMNNLGEKFNVKILDALRNFSITEVKRKFSIKGSKVNILNQMIDDFKAGKLTELNIQPNKSNIDVSKIDKEQVNEILEDYQQMQKRAKDNEKLDAGELKEKFNISGTKAKILDEFVEDLRKENPSVASIAIKRTFDPDNTDKKKMLQILKKYDKDSIAIKKRIKENENLDADKLKDKFSVYGYKAKILDAFVEDLKKGKKSAAGIKFDPNKVNKEQMIKILNEYAEKSPVLHKLYEEYQNRSTNDLKRSFSISSSKKEMLEDILSRFKM